MDKLPNFFIIGAPKCGTTALAQYLSLHPNVFMSVPKEPHYFASDMLHYRVIQNATEYISLFEKAECHHKRIGEASVWYLYSETAIKNIFLFNKNVKLIVMLRKPVDMVYSMYYQHLYNLQEDIGDFELAWDIEIERKKGKSIPKNNFHPPILFYSEIAKYYTQLSKVYNYFPPEQLKIIIFDDFVTSTSHIYAEILDFLELPPYEKITFEAVNKNKVYKNRLLQKMTVQIHKKRFLIQKFKKRFNIQRIGISHLIHILNKVEEERKPLNPIVKKRVIGHYKEEVDNLGKLLNRDLSHWNKL